MENRGLGTHNDKMCAESLTGNTPNTPQFIWPICPKRPIIWDIFEKSPHNMCIVHVRADSVQEMCIKCFAVHKLIFEILHHIFFCLFCGFKDFKF